MIYENETFEGITLADEMLEDMKFICCRFVGCIIDSAKFINCIFNQCLFEKCRIISPKVRGSELSYTQFEECSVIGVNFGDLCGSGDNLYLCAAL